MDNYLSIMENYASIMDMAMGAVKERVDYEMVNVIHNICDPNTKAAKKRRIVITLDILPDDNRRNIQVFASANHKLEPATPIVISLYLTDDENGEKVVIEKVPQVPGQQNMYGVEQAEPKILRLPKQA